MYCDIWLYGWMSPKVRKRNSQGGMPGAWPEPLRCRKSTVWREYGRWGDKECSFGHIKLWMPLDIHEEMSGPWLDRVVRSYERVPAGALNLGVISVDVNGIWTGGQWMKEGRGAVSLEACRNQAEKGAGK